MIIKNVKVYMKSKWTIFILLAHIVKFAVVIFNQNSICICSGMAVLLWIGQTILNHAPPTVSERWEEEHNNKTPPLLNIQFQLEIRHHTEIKNWKKLLVHVEFKLKTWL